MPKGPPPRPARLKLAARNPGHRPINAREPVPSADLPKPAEWLPKGAVVQFGELVTKLDAMGYASSSYEAALNLLALQLWRAAEAARILDEIGHRGAEAARIRAMFNQASRQAQSLLAEFGLSPSSSSRISVPSRAEGNPFAKFRTPPGDDSAA